MKHAYRAALPEHSDATPVLCMIGLLLLSAKHITELAKSKKKEWGGNERENHGHRPLNGRLYVAPTLAPHPL